MLGHLYPSTCSLEDTTKAHYKNLYCSICSSIREKNHMGYTFLINNELTLVLLSLRSYYQPTEGKTPCPSSLFTQKNPISKHEVIQKASDLSVLLGWIKSEDWQADKGNFFTKIINQNFQKKAHPLLQNTSTVFQETIEEYIKLTQDDNHDFEFVKKQSSILSKALLLELALHCHIPESHLKVLLALFQEAGILINVVDHLLDLDKDFEKKEYNPILENASSTKEIAQNYYTLKQKFQQHIKKARQVLHWMKKYDISNDSFHISFDKSLSRMQTEVSKKTPQLIQTFEKNTPLKEIQVVQNTCSPTECTCMQPDNQEFVAAGCNQCCGNCNNCCNGCNSCCNNCNGCQCPCNNCQCGQCCNGCTNCCDGCTQCCNTGDGCCKSCDNSCRSCNCNNCCDCNGCDFKGCQCGGCCDSICFCNNCESDTCCDLSCDSWCKDSNHTPSEDLTAPSFMDQLLEEKINKLSAQEDSLRQFLQNDSLDINSIQEELEQIQEQKESIKEFKSNLKSKN